jgi:hypothetical protein
MPSPKVPKNRNNRRQKQRGRKKNPPRREPPAETKSRRLHWDFMTPDHKPLILAAIGFTIGFAATATADFIRPTLAEKPAAVKEPVRMLADQPPVRVVGAPLVLNVNPSER